MPTLGPRKRAEYDDGRIDAWRQRVGDEAAGAVVDYFHGRADDEQRAVVERYITWCINTAAPTTIEAFMYDIMPRRIPPWATSGPADTGWES